MAQTRRVGVLGHGAIGAVVARCLADGGVVGAELSAVGLRKQRDLGDLPVMTVSDMIDASDLVVEVGGQPVLAEWGRTILDHGRDLLTVSIGALADDAIFEQLTTSGPGRLHICTGAIGGIDMIRAAAAMGPITSARITSSKKPAGLVQPTMSPEEAERVRSLTERTVLFEGDIRTLVGQFPASTNIAAALALAVGDWDIVRGTVVADPAATVSTHIIEVSGEAGDYRFEMRHRPSPNNPRSSAMVPWSVIRALRDLCDPSWTFV
jgi:aspartate dehydrogenase